MPLPHLGQVIHDEFDEREDLHLGGKVGAYVTDGKANVHVLDLLQLLIRVEYKEYGCGADVYIVLATNGLEDIDTYQNLQVGQGNSLHVESALQQCKADVPKAETLVTLEHVLGYRLLALDVQQEALEAELGHLQKKTRVLT